MRDYIGVIVLVLFMIGLALLIHYTDWSLGSFMTDTLESALSC